MLWLLPAKNKKHLITVPHGYLISPINGCKHAIDSELSYGIDNDAYNGKFSESRFLKLLDRMMPYSDRCLFANPPDVVGDAVQTTKNFYIWHHRITQRGFPISYICQDGMISIPKDVSVDALFIGGSTEFKLSEYIMNLLIKVRNKYCIHIGRVNTLRRLLHFRNVADSFDGTQAYRFQPDVGTKYIHNSLMFIQQQSELMLK